MKSQTRLLLGTLMILLSSWAHANPVANAGPDQVVTQGSVVILDGSASIDNEGVGIFYRWEQIAGADVDLGQVNDTDNLASAKQTFIAPNTCTVMTFLLEVGDRSASDTDTVDIIINTNCNNAPVANAGADISVRAGASIALDGTQSYDPDSNPITYLWSQTGGPAATLTNGNTATPTITTSVSNTTLEFQVLVSDGNLSSTDKVLVNVTAANGAPVANAGSDLTVNEFTNPVTLNGSASSDPDADAISYQWSQVSGPAVTLVNPTSATPTFSAPSVNTSGADLTFQLVVKDNYIYDPKVSVPDQVVVHVRDVNAAPNCGLAYPSVSVLWPPNHTMREISIAGLSDPNNPYSMVSINITGVTQDEPVSRDQGKDNDKGKKDGKSNKDKYSKKDGKYGNKKDEGRRDEDRDDDNDDRDSKGNYTSPDAVILDGSVMLRSERDGYGNGRVYRIAFTASNAAGSCSGSVTVSVPHDMAHNAIDDGQNYVSTSEHEYDHHGDNDHDDDKDHDHHHGRGRK